MTSGSSSNGSPRVQTRQRRILLTRSTEKIRGMIHLDRDIYEIQ